MNNRSLRRAAERQARKLAQKRPLSDPPTATDQPSAENHLDFPPEPSSAGTKTPVSPARLAANRANAQDEPAVFSEAKIQAKTTGPASEAGRATSSLNALKTGLTGRTILLPSDDVAAYQAHLARFEAQWKPATDPERALLQSIVDTEWRLLRIPSLESGIYALGRLELAGEFQDHSASGRQALIDTKIFLTYQRQLNNLSIQENRLRRQRDKDVERLEQLQSEREQSDRDLAEQREKALHQAALALETAKKEGVPFVPAANGFEFSTDELDTRLSLIVEARERRRQINAQADAQHAAFRAQAIAKVRRQSEAA